MVDKTSPVKGIFPSETDSFKLILENKGKVFNEKDWLAYFDENGEINPFAPMQDLSIGDRKAIPVMSLDVDGDPNIYWKEQVYFTEPVKGNCRLWRGTTRQHWPCTR